MENSEPPSFRVPLIGEWGRFLVLYFLSLEYGDFVLRNVWKFFVCGATSTCFVSPKSRSSWEFWLEVLTLLKLYIHDFKDKETSFFAWIPLKVVSIKLWLLKIAPAEIYSWLWQTKFGFSFLCDHIFSKLWNFLGTLK